MDSIERAFAAHSPRLAPRPVSLGSRAVSLVGPLVFVVLTAQVFFRLGLLAWAVGIAYVVYDTFLLAFTALQILPLRRPPQAPAPLPVGVAAPTVGVIVAAHNEAAVLGVTIDTLAAQDPPPDCIVLADDGSDDASAMVLAERYGLQAPSTGQLSQPAPGLPSLRWLRLAHGGKARALNAALPLLDTELALTVDADTLLAPGALAAMRDAFAADPRLVAATGVLEPVCGRRPLARVFQWFQRYEYVRNFLSRYAWMRQDSLLLVSGAFAGFRRDAVLEVGGFDPACLVEDYELIHRLYRHAFDQGLEWQVRVLGRARASTDAPAGPLAFLRQRRRWFGGFLQTQSWNLDMVANPRFGRLGMRMLTVKALDTVQPLYGLTAFGILLWLVASGRYVVAGPVLAVMLAKVAVDLGFHLWSIRLYARWVGHDEGLGLGAALLASLVEPFSFQLLRHLGACWGWAAFVSGRGGWARQRREAMTAPSAAVDGLPGPGP